MKLLSDVCLRTNNFDSINSICDLQRRRAPPHHSTRPPRSPVRVPTAPKKPEKSEMEKFREVLVDKLGSENDVIRSILAEFIGTFFLLVSNEFYFLLISQNYSLLVYLVSQYYFYLSTPQPK